MDIYTADSVVSEGRTIILILHTPQYQVAGIEYITLLSRIQQQVGRLSKSYQSLKRHLRSAFVFSPVTFHFAYALLIPVSSHTMGLVTRVRDSEEVRTQNDDPNYYFWEYCLHKKANITSGNAENKIEH